MNDENKLPRPVSWRTPTSICVALAIGSAVGVLLIRSNCPPVYGLYFALAGSVLVSGALCPLAARYFYLIGFAYSAGVAGATTLLSLHESKPHSVPHNWWEPTLFFVVLFCIIGLASLLPATLWLFLKPNERLAREQLKWGDGRPLRIDSRKAQWFIAGGVHFVLCVLMVGATYWVLPKVPWDAFPGYRPVDYDWRLTQRARTAPVLIDALAQFRHDHSKYPEDWDQLLPYLPAGSEATLPEIAGWHYWKHPDETGYTLSLKLGWDPGLRYHFEGSQGHWEFEPGDGTESTRIILDP